MEVRAGNEKETRGRGSVGRGGGGGGGQHMMIFLSFPAQALLYRQLTSTTWLDCPKHDMLCMSGYSSLMTFLWLAGWRAPAV